MKKKELTFLRETFLFSEMEESEILSILNDITPQTLFFEKGDRLDFSFSEEKKIAFILSGECDVMRGKIIINTLKKGDSFGILSVFSNECYPTHILAKKRSSILFLTKDMLLSIIECSSKIAMNTIRFLAGRITFLNQRVAMLGGASVEEKCLAYLKEQYQRYGSEFNLPVSSVARKISAGRASLYRALDALESKGTLKRTDNTVQILHPELL